MNVRRTTDLRRFGPKTADHPSVGKQCGKCNKPLAAGDYTTLVPMRETDVTPNVKVVEASEQHWDCAVTSSESLVTSVLVDDESHAGFDWVDVFSQGARAGVLCVAKGLGEGIAQRLMPPASKMPKPQSPPAPFGDWRSHLRYTMEFEPNPEQPAPQESVRRAVAAVDALDVGQGVRHIANMLHQWSAQLEMAYQLARATNAPLTLEQKATIRNVEEVVRSAAVAYLSILAEKDRGLS